MGIMPSFQQRTQVNSPEFLGIYLVFFCDGNEDEEGKKHGRIFNFYGKILSTTVQNFTEKKRLFKSKEVSYGICDSN